MRYNKDLNRIFAPENANNFVMNNLNSASFMSTIKLYSKIKSNQKKQKESNRNHTRLMWVLFATVAAILLLASCANDSSSYQFKDSDDALSSYHSFLSELRAKKNITGDELVSTVSTWTELRDTVYNFISKDTTFRAHTNLPNAFFAIHDSIRTEMNRLAVEQDRSLKDVFLVKKATSIYNKEKDIKTASADAQSFFEHLDSLDIYKADKKQTLGIYQKFLDQVGDGNVKTLDDLKSIISAEDRIFRTFLAHINEYADVSLTHITKGTEHLCKNIYANAANGDMDAKQVMVYMYMRTNRRLALNAMACVESVNRRDRLTDAQRHAYFWMILQPYIGIDDFGMAVLTSGQEQILLAYADELQRMDKAHKLGERSKNLSETSQLLLKLYLSSL